METSSDSRDNWSGMAPVSELFLSVSALHSNQTHDDNLKGVQRTEAGGSDPAATEHHRSVRDMVRRAACARHAPVRVVVGALQALHEREAQYDRGARSGVSNGVSTMNHKRILHIYNMQSGRHSHTDRVGLDWPV